MSTKPHLASLNDADAIMAFIHRYWSTNHVLAVNRELFDWQYRNDEEGCYNFLLARDSDREIAGILGFIPISRYAPELADEDTVWLTTWKVRPELASGLGALLLWAMPRIRPSKWIGTVGLNSAVPPIYAALGYSTGRLDRFFLLNRQLKEYQLAEVPNEWRQSHELSTGAKLSHVLERDLVHMASTIESTSTSYGPRKTCSYISARYCRHPYYEYDVWLLDDHSGRALLVTRVCKHNERNALRIVDYIGLPSVLRSAGTALHELLLAYDAEYLDFYSSNLTEELLAAGLHDVAQAQGTILPGYFEPFERRNVDILYAFKGAKCMSLLCKGDADQDRPNDLGQA